MSAVRHVLLDADGVLQQPPGGWHDVAERVLGDRAAAVLPLLDDVERPALVGGDLLPSLARTLRDAGVTAPAEEVHAGLWLAIEPDTASFALVGELRAAGYGVHLGTNQHARRAAYLRETLGYDEVFDTCFCSCDLGVAKPDTAFFEAVCERLGADPGEVVFVDDVVANVDAARRAGLRAERWDLRRDHAELRSLLAAHGVEPGQCSGARR